MGCIVTCDSCEICYDTIIKLCIARVSNANGLQLAKQEYIRDYVLENCLHISILLIILMRT